MDKKRSFLNIFFSLFFKIAILILSLFTRKYIIRFLGNELNGLSSLYTSIIGVLCVVELGIGSAITFSMYKPIIDKDQNKVNALYNLYKKLYSIVGIIILVAGIVILPVLPYIANDYNGTVSLPDMYFGYILYLISIVMTYFYSAKISLINAHKDNYITTIITQSSQILLYILQILSLFIFKSFIIFNFIRIIIAGINLLALNIYVRKKYSQVIIGKNEVEEAERKKINKNIKAMFYHKIGAELVNTSDNIIISAFLGVIILGKYSNYSTLCVSMMSILTLVFTSLTAIIGHFYVSKDSKEVEKSFRFFHTLNFLIGVLFFICFYSVIDNFILLFYDNSKDLVLERSAVLIITLNYFIQYFRKATLTFRDATGTFYNDRYIPIVEGIINIIVSIIFVMIFGLVGVIIATILTNLFICYIFEPFILYKHAFKLSSKKFLIKNYIYTGLFIGVILSFDWIRDLLIPQLNGIQGFLLNGFFGAGIALIVSIIVLIVDKNFRETILSFLKRKNKKI